MAIRTFRPNFRTRAGVDPTLWNRFFRDLELDILDLLSPSGAEPLRETDLGVSEFLDDYDITVSGFAGKEPLLDENS